MLVDVFARALEQAGVTSEVLGFTTGAWNGGRALRDWQRAGKPRHPGRLNERCHLVFKSGDAPWRRARPSIATLLKADLFREGIDGEAVDWACARLLSRVEERKLLLVISDGSPMDSATQLANDAHYLDHHLREVVSHHEQAGQVETGAIGVGLDLSPYYRHSQVIDLAAATGNQVFAEIMGLMARLRR
jgi:cobaltochelatase CobT